MDRIEAPRYPWFLREKPGFDESRDGLEGSFYSKPAELALRRPELPFKLTHWNVCAKTLCLHSRNRLFRNSHSI